MKREFISVIVPVYNVEYYLKQCLDSIVNQTYRNLEIILVDDGSTDSSGDICDEYAQIDARIKVIHKENGGVSSARNAALDLCTPGGDLVAFVDSDDWIDKDYINSFIDVLNDNPMALTICGYVNHDEKYNGRTDNVIWSNTKKNVSAKLKPELKTIYDRTLLQQLWNKAFVTKIIQDNKLKFDESISIGEDLRFILEYIKVSEIQDVVFINKPLYHYMRDQDGSLMYKVGLESVEEPLKNLRSLYELIGYSKNKIKESIDSDSKKQVNLYAYLIMHNAGMKMKEKKRLIFSLDSQNGKILYKNNRNIYYKEKISKAIRR